MKKFYAIALILTLIFVIFTVFGIVQANSPAECPPETSELFFMGEDESACYYQRDLPRSNAFEVVTIDK